MKIPKISLIFISLAFLIMYHQYITHGKWFELKDIHHESLIIAFILIAIVLFFYINIKEKK